MHPDDATVVAEHRRTGDRRAPVGEPVRWNPGRTLLLGAVTTPVRPLTRATAALGSAVLLAESAGLVARLTCGRGACGEPADAWARRLDMDALGSLPRALITVLLAAVAVGCARAVLRAGRDGAGVWWSVLGLGAFALAVAKHTSVHSLVERRLAGVLPGVDVQLLFVVVSVAGLVVVTVSGRWVRRETRVAVTTWLVLYAAAAVGLAALSTVLGGVAPLLGDLATWIEETGEGLATVGLLAVVRVEARAVARRR